MTNNIKSLSVLSAMFVLIAVSYVIGAASQSLFNQTIYLVFPVLAAVSAFFVAKIYGFGDTNGRRLLLIALGFSFWALGDILWYLFLNFFNINPFPSAADVFYLAGYLLVFAGIYMTIRQAQISFDDLKKISKAVLTINILLAIVLTLIVSYYSIYQVYDPEAGAIYNFFSIGYGVADLLLIFASMFALTIVHAYRGGKLAAFWLRMIVGFLLFLVADILFALFAAQFEEGLKPFVYIDLIYIASYLIFTYAMLNKFFSLRRLQEDIKEQLAQKNKSTETPAV